MPGIEVDEKEEAKEDEVRDDGRAKVALDRLHVAFPQLPRADDLPLALHLRPFLETSDKFCEVKNFKLPETFGPVKVMGSPIKRVD